MRHADKHAQAALERLVEPAGGDILIARTTTGFNKFRLLSRTGESDDDIERQVLLRVGGVAVFDGLGSDEELPKRPPDSYFGLSAQTHADAETCRNTVD